MYCQEYRATRTFQHFSWDCKITHLFYKKFCIHKSMDRRILQARILEWVAMLSSRESSWPRYWTQVLYISPLLAGGFFITNTAWGVLINTLLPIQIILNLIIYNPKIKTYIHKITRKTMTYLFMKIKSVQSLSRVWLFATPWMAARQPPCPSQIPRVHPNSCPLSQWCHPAISSSVIPFSSCLQSFTTSGSFQMSQLFTSGRQNIGASASTSVLPMNTQDWFPLGWTGCISLQSKGLSRVFSNTTVWKHQFFSAQLSSQSNSDIHTWPLEKP